jgi:hypothetical protein
MTTQEIQDFSARANMDAEFNGKRVFIKNDEGKYLTPTSIHGGISFTDNKNLAYTYDYTEDRVADQLEQVKQQYGKTWTPEIRPSKTNA